MFFFLIQFKEKWKASLALKGFPTDNSNDEELSQKQEEVGDFI